MHFNWIDIGIIAVIVFYVIAGWEEGIIRQGIGLVSFLASLWAAIRYHVSAGKFLTEKFGVAVVWSQVLGYAAVAIIAEIVISELLVILVNYAPKKLFASQVNRSLGALLSAAKGLVIVTLGLILISVLPLRGTIRQDISQSQVSKVLLTLADHYAGGVRTSLNNTAKDMVRFLTIKPQSNEKVSLEAQLPEKLNLNINAQAENEMFTLVNQERVKAGVKPLRIDPKIVPVARAHSKDMFERRYFAHIDPDGKDAGDRLAEAGIRYQVAGENLAYAPDVKTAHEGLMNSEGHRKNILSPEFSRVGIGIITADSADISDVPSAIDAGVYGLMVTQNFAD